MKFSTMTYTFSRQAETFDLDRMLRWTAEHMDGIDFVRLHDRPAKELRARCDDLGIHVAAHTFFAKGLPSEDPAQRQEGLDDCKRGLEDALILGAPVVMIPTPGQSGAERDPLRRRWIEGLKDVAPLAAEAGVTLTVENFPGDKSPFVLADDFSEARAAVPGLKLTFDNGNAGSGENPADSFRRCAGDVVHAHFKDWDVVDTQQEGYRPMLDGQFYRAALIGEGVIDHRGCLQAMREAGYDGFINIEYEGNAYDPFDATQRAVEHLRGILAELG